MTLDLETRPVGIPMRLARPAPAPAPASPAAASVPSDSPPASQPSPHQAVDLTDHAASYWVRRRRAQAAAEH
jgi:hypothetical protein